MADTFENLVARFDALSYSQRALVLMTVGGCDDRHHHWYSVHASSRELRESLFKALLASPSRSTYIRLWDAIHAGPCSESTWRLYPLGLVNPYKTGPQDTGAASRASDPMGLALGDLLAEIVEMWEATLAPADPFSIYAEGVDVVRTAATLAMMFMTRADDARVGADHHCAGRVRRTRTVKDALTRGLVRMYDVIANNKQWLYEQASLIGTLHERHVSGKSVLVDVHAFVDAVRGVRAKAGVVDRSSGKA